MTPAQHRLRMGALGGLVPIVVNLLVVDLASVLSHLTVIVAVSYGVRVTAMAAAGAIGAWLHEKEVQPSKLFQLGMAAPGVLAMTINGAALRSDASAGVSFGTAVHAAQTVESAQVPQETVGQQIVRGLFGISAKTPDWIVVAAQAEHESSARTVAARLEAAHPEVTWVILAPSGAIRTWLVTLGGPMTESDAQAVAEVQAGAIGGLPVRVRRLSELADGQGSQ